MIISISSFLSSSIGVLAIFSIIYFNQICKLTYKQTVLIYIFQIIFLIIIGISYGFDSGILFALALMLSLAVFVLAIRKKW